MAKFTLAGNDFDALVSGFKRWTRAGGSSAVERTINNTGRSFTTTGKEIFYLEFEDLDDDQFQVLRDAHTNAMGSSLGFEVDGSAFTCAFSTPNQLPSYDVVLDPETRSMRYRTAFTIEEL